MSPRQVRCPGRGGAAGRRPRPPRRWTPRSPPAAPSSAARRRTRARAGRPRARTSAAPARAGASRSVRGGRSCRPAEALQLAVAPRDSPLAVVERPAVDEVDERRIGAEAVVEAAQILEHLPVPLAAGSEQAGAAVTRQGVRQEEPQERLVAHLDPRVRAAEPGVDGRRAGRRDAIDAAGAAAAGLVVTGDPAGGLETAQL